MSATLDDDESRQVTDPLPPPPPSAQAHAHAQAHAQTQGAADHSHSVDIPSVLTNNIPGTALGAGVGRPPRSPPPPAPSRAAQQGIPEFFHLDPAPDTQAAGSATNHNHHHHHHPPHRRAHTQGTTFTGEVGGAVLSEAAAAPGAVTAAAAAAAGDGNSKAATAAMDLGSMLASVTPDEGVASMSSGVSSLNGPGNQHAQVNDAAPAKSRDDRPLSAGNTIGQLGNQLASSSDNVVRTDGDAVATPPGPLFLKTVPSLDLPSGGALFNSSVFSYTPHLRPDFSEDNAAVSPSGDSAVPVRPGPTAASVREIAAAVSSSAAIPAAGLEGMATGQQPQDDPVVQAAATMSDSGVASSVMIGHVSLQGSSETTLSAAGASATVSNQQALLTPRSVSGMEQSKDGHQMNHAHSSQDAQLHRQQFHNQQQRQRQRQHQYQHQHQRSFQQQHHDHRFHQQHQQHQQMLFHQMMQFQEAQRGGAMQQIVDYGEHRGHQSRIGYFGQAAGAQHTGFGQQYVGPQQHVFQNQSPDDQGAARTLAGAGIRNVGEPVYSGLNGSQSRMVPAASATYHHQSQSRSESQNDSTTALDTMPPGGPGGAGLLTPSSDPQVGLVRHPVDAGGNPSEPLGQEVHLPAPPAATFEQLDLDQQPWPGMQSQFDANGTPMELQHTRTNVVEPFSGLTFPPNGHATSFSNSNGSGHPMTQYQYDWLQQHHMQQQQQHHGHHHRQGGGHYVLPHHYNIHNESAFAGGGRGRPRGGRNHSPNRFHEGSRFQHTSGQGARGARRRGGRGRGKQGFDRANSAWHGPDAGRDSHRNGRGRGRGRGGTGRGNHRGGRGRNRQFSSFSANKRGDDSFGNRGGYSHHPRGTRRHTNFHSTGGLNSSSAFGHFSIDALSVEDIRGQVLAMSKEQYGCRLLQQALERERVHQASELDSGGDDEQAATVSPGPFWQQIFLEVRQKLVFLMVDPFGNYLFQKLVQFASPNEEQAEMLEAVAPQLIPASLSSHGTRAVQKMIEVCKAPEQVLCFFRMHACAQSAVRRTGFL